ncbi:MAG: OmpA family protein [Victivallales bacterium]|nr:OmpA family protein [Victivallales bacterium]MCF7889063.1 OmpA family protein [Victivallales bacterium]
MRLTKFFLLAVICFLVTALAGCAWFRGETVQPGGKQKNTVSDKIPQLGGDDSDGIVIDLGSGTETLPSRPTKDWKPIKENKVTIYFAFDQSSIGTAQIPQLEAVAEYLKKHQHMGLIIQGYCDERGSHEYNIGLGERRALAVRDFLVSLGVPDNHLQTISYGSERPAVSGHTEFAYSKNRRAVLIPAEM